MRMISYLGGNLIEPGIAIPDKGRLVAIELVPKNNKVELVSYVFVCPQTPFQLYEQYRKVYQPYRARWTGKYNDKNYAFAVAVRWGTNPPRDGTRIVFRLSSGLSDEEMKAYRLPARDKSLTLVSATFYSPRLDALIRKQPEFILLV